jgi:hypothetical protein
MLEMTDMPNRFDDLPPKTKAFLMGLRPDEVETLGDGIRLVNSIRTVGNFVKWLIVGILGLALGTVMFGESVAKILAWFRG